MLTLGAGLLIRAAQSDLFIAIHTLAAVSTVGFSGFDDSLAHMTVLIRAAVILVCVLCAR